MAGQKSQARQQTMEVPKVLRVRVNDGILESVDKRGSAVNILFRHLQLSMNDKNAVDVLKSLAGAHGYEIEIQG